MRIAKIFSLNRLFILSLFFLLQSCQFYERRLPSEELLLKQKLEEINWKEVSVYPALPPCDGYFDKKRRRDCFFKEMGKILNRKFQMDSLTFAKFEIDTFWVKVTVNSDATVLFETQLSTIPEEKRDTLNSMIQQRLLDFPKIEPAQKEGIPVRTEFLLPVVVRFEH
jgi:hypothetical protein